MVRDSRIQVQNLGDGTDSVLRENGTSSILRPAAFVPFDEDGEVRIYQRNLPHWRQDACTYFVTFRLVDSIPEGVRREWEYEQKMWLLARGIQYDGPRGSWRAQLDKLAGSERHQFEKHFDRKAQACLDRGLGECWLKEAACISALREELFKADGERHHLGDFVIMPNHVHLLTTPIAGHELEIVLKIEASTVETDEGKDRSEEHTSELQSH